MSIVPSSKKDTKHRNDDCKNNCEENDTATQKTITAERTKYCDELYALAGEVIKWETNYTGQVKLYEVKKCIFTWTEDNYRRYRNTEICVGTELLQSNDLIKENVGNYVKWGNDLFAALKNIFKYMKDVKVKLNDLRDAACKLENCKNDSCNCTQIIILTGEMPENCKDDTELPGNRPPECNDAKKNLDDLICMPKALSFDADSLFKASADVVGIQVFSNIGTLEPLQKALAEDSKAFEKHFLDTTTTRAGDLKKAQEELVKAVQEATKATGGLYNKRSDHEGLLCVTRFLCCPNCDCVDDEGDCKPRLDQCKKEICDICEDVKETFCTEGSNDEDESKAV